MGVAAEGGPGVRRRQVQVQVPGQVFEPHRRVFWEEGLTVSQLLLQVAHVQLPEEQGGDGLG